MLFSALLVAASLAQPGYYRQPAVHQDMVVFVSEGDLWSVPLTGGPARRLTTHPGEETHPEISPEGSMVAFIGEYEGSAEVYTMPLEGGPVTRRTWGADRAQTVGWAPDGRLLYTSRHFSLLPSWQLIALDLETSVNEPMPLAEAAEGVIGDDGRLYFVRYQFQGSHTKRYRGGTARDIWVFGPDMDEAERLTPDQPGEDIEPMWWGGRVYFASERGGSMNIWSMAPDGSDVRQHTEHDGFDVRSPGMGEGVIVYQLGADLWSLDVTTGLNRLIEIDLAGDRDQLRERWIDEPMRWLTAAHLDHAGERVVMTARGEVFVAPVEEGRIARLTRQRAGRYRNARFIPESDEILALSDETGELEFWSLRADGYGEPVQVTSDAANHRQGAVIAPDGRHVAWFDTDFGLWLHEFANEKTQRIDEGIIDNFSGLTFSPDGRMLAYVRSALNEFQQIWVYDIERERSIALTNDRVHSYSPAFSADGSWLFYLGDRHFETVVGSPWGAYQPEPLLARRTTLNAIPLTGPTRSPFRPDDELTREAAREEAEAEEDADDDADETGEADASADEAEATGEGDEESADDEAVDDEEAIAYDFTDLAARTIHVPVEPGEYSGLTASKEHLYWLRRDALDGSAPPELVAIKIDNDDPKVVVVASGVTAYEMSGDHEKVLVRTGRAMAVGPANGTKIDMKKGAVDLGGWSFALDPREEFRQMFHEAWRLERDYFYDPAMHGVDWKEVLDRHTPLVDRVASRAELSDLISQMVGELSALHIYVAGGEFRSGDDDVSAGSLGARLVRDEEAGGYRIAQRFRSDPEYPARRGPLMRPDLEINDGDLITHINGVPLLSVADPGVVLRDQAGKQVRLRIEDGEGAVRDVMIEAISNRGETALRYDEWELTRREMVEAWGDGDIGYVHVRAMSGSNYAEDFARDFYPLIRRQGLIVDVRHNRGGNIDSWLLSRLMRRAWMYWQGRAGTGTWNMQQSFNGHIVVLCDAWTASDGEAFCDGFRRLGLGEVIGVRTWGGEIWLSFSNRLVDNGIASAAEYGVYGPEGEWLIEGHGFVPDQEVDNLPHATYEGGDAQLRAAIEHLKAKIAADPRPTPPAPPFPDKSKAADDARRNPPAVPPGG